MEHTLSRMSCPVCGERESKTVYRCLCNSPPISHYMARVYAPEGVRCEKTLDGVEFRVEECVRCRMLYQVRIPGDDLSFKLYEEWINPESTFRKQTEFDLAAPLALVPEIVSAIRYLGGVPTKIRCLDYGMGWGTWCAVAKGLGCQAFGTELSEARKREASARGIGIVPESDIQAKISI